jgi:hypothetical protein
MFTAVGYAAVQARVRARRSRLLDPAAWRRLVAVRRADDVVDALVATPYGPYLSDAPGVDSASSNASDDIARARLERALQRRLDDETRSLGALLPPRARDLLDWYASAALVQQAMERYRLEGRPFYLEVALDLAYGAAWSTASRPSGGGTGPTPWRCSDVARAHQPARGRALPRARRGEPRGDRELLPPPRLRRRPGDGAADRGRRLARDEAAALGVAPARRARARRRRCSSSSAPPTGCSAPPPAAASAGALRARPGARLPDRARGRGARPDDAARGQGAGPRRRRTCAARPREVT